MKKNIALIMLTLGGWLIGTTFLTGCKNDEESGILGTGAIKITSQILETGTRSDADIKSALQSKEEWVPGDGIGVFMKVTGKNLSEGILGNVDNYQYLATASGKFTDFRPSSIETEIYYPYGEKVDFIAYSPYRKLESTGTNSERVYPVSLGKQNDFISMDLLFAELKGKNDLTADVALMFEHKMSRIILDVSKSSSFTEQVNLSKMETIMSDFIVTADFSLEDKKFKNRSKGEDIIPEMIEENEGVRIEAIVIPQEAAETDPYITFRFKSSARELKWYIPNAKSFKSGKIHRYKILLCEEGVSFIDESIQEWGAKQPSVNGGGIIPIDTIDILPAIFYRGDYWIGTANNTNLKDIYPRTKAKLASTIFVTQEISNLMYARFLNEMKIGQDGKMTKEGEYKGKILIKDSSTQTENKGVVMKGATWVPAEGCEDLPVVYVTWYGAIAFAEWLGGDLPTEQEWEIICRSGSDKDTKYWFSDALKTNNMNEIVGYINCYEYAITNNSTRGTVSVYNLQPNSSGLHNMSGNVAEWCRDRCELTSEGIVTGTEESTDPGACGQMGKSRIVRGGSYITMFENACTAVRGCSLPEDARDDLGFRITLPVGFSIGKYPELFLKVNN